jgi:hypothetical protein
VASSTIDWPSLQHAYGAASDIPALLKSAETAPAPQRYDQDPWYSLWSALCHQEDVYPASYAAVPELVRIAASRQGSGRAECLLLAGCIELERHNGRAPELPVALVEPYREAVAFGAALAGSSLPSAMTAVDTRRLQIAVAAFRGDHATARRLLGDDEEDES